MMEKSDPGKRQMCIRDRAVPEVLAVEYMEADGDVFNIQRIIQNPVLADHGMVKAPEGPGHGLILDEAALERYRWDG